MPCSTPRRYLRGVEQGTHFFQYPSMGYGGINEVYAPSALYKTARLASTAMQHSSNDLNSYGITIRENGPQILEIIPNGDVGVPVNAIRVFQPTVQ